MDAKYIEGYNAAFEDMANFLEHLGGSAGPESSFTNEADAAVQCVQFMVMYGTWHEAALNGKLASDFLKLDILSRPKNSYSYYPDDEG